MRIGTLGLAGDISKEIPQLHRDATEINSNTSIRYEVNMSLNDM